MLELKQLQPLYGYASPYEYEANEFNHRWWNSSALNRLNEPDRFCLSFLNEGQEIARAFLAPYTLADDYVNYSLSRDVMLIDFFEVAESCRRKGFGKSAVELIIQHFQKRILAAFSENADDFWTAAGFTNYPRVDGGDKRIVNGALQNAPLYIYNNLS